MSMNVNAVMLGAIAMASLVAALFFLRFWKNTRDRFFLFFAIAFLAEAVNRAALGLTAISQEQEPFFYLVRLGAFGLILVAIVDKNRAEKLPRKFTYHSSQSAMRR
jgi:uncharacterized membrane protein HdeD (DUF308 family)